MSQGERQWSDGEWLRQVGAFLFLIRIIHLFELDISDESNKYITELLADYWTELVLHKDATSGGTSKINS